MRAAWGAAENAAASHQEADTPRNMFTSAPWSLFEQHRLYVLRLHYIVPQ